MFQVVSVKTYKLWDRIICLYNDFKRYDKYFYWIVPLIFGIWTLPNPIIFPGSGLDPSWVVGLNLAFLENFQFGRDIIFTFGPLGFLWVPVLMDYRLWVLSLTVTLIAHFLFVVCLFYVVKKTFGKLNYYIIVLIPILIFAIPYFIEYKLLMIASLMLYLILTDSLSSKENPSIFAFIGLLLSIATLIKFTAFFMSISLIVMFFLCCLFLKKEVKYGLYLLVSYLIFLISIWIFAGQNIYNLASYFYSGIEISNGYVDAMGVPGPEWQVFLGIASLCIFFIIILSSAKESKKNVFVFSLLNLGIFLVAFKHGFVRHDGHQFYFFQICLLLFLLLSFLVNSYVSDRKLKYLNLITIILIIPFLFSMYYSAPWMLNDNIKNKYQSYVLSEQMVVNQESFKEQVTNSKVKVCDDYHIDKSMIKYLENKKVDIFPWDISLAWAYGLGWSPRPIFQSYSAYTHYLDEKNSYHFINAGAPDNILYTYASIDNRYPIFDEPLTFRNVLLYYKYQNESGNFILLSKSKDLEISSQVEDLGTVEAKCGEIIEVPKYQGYVFAYIDFDYSLFGKIIKIFYKPHPVTVKFLLKDGEITQEFRFLPNVASDGVYISQYIGSNQNLTHVFQGELDNNIQGFLINTDHPEYYSKDVLVKFVGVPKG
jgi:hypothetical protein